MRMAGAQLSRGEGAPHLRPFRFRSIASTHPGMVRKLNEDACLDRPEVGLWAVADGMGGHDAGDLASETVIQSLAGVSAFDSAFAFRRGVRMALLAANEELRRKADEQMSGVIGSTVVTLIAHGGHYACMWAGDSRAYLLRDDRLERVTRDHSLVQEMISAGAIEESQIRFHPRANVVTRAVGADTRLDLDGVYGRIQPGDRFLLCSDGVGAVLTDGELEAHMRGSALQDAAGSLLRNCLARGAPDNVTLLLVEAAAA